MLPVPETFLLPAPTARSLGDVMLFNGILQKLLQKVVGLFGFRLNRVLPKDGTEPMTAPLPLASYLTAGKPSATGRAGQIIFVSDGGAGNVFQGSNGTTWVSLG